MTKWLWDERASEGGPVIYYKTTINVAAGEHTVVCIDADDQPEVWVDEERVI